VVPISETTVQLEYDIPSSNPITLLLEYDPLSRRLVDASVSLFPSFSSFLPLHYKRIREDVGERKGGWKQRMDADKQLLGADIDIKEGVDWAVVSNDVPGLIADILNRLRR
jgi:hypothetical protein